MWQCPNCKRNFRIQNQNHFCGEPPKSIDEYIMEQPEKIRPFLVSVRDTLRAALPEATEKISYGMPTYYKGRNIIHFAAQRNHLGIYPGDKAVAHFSERLKGFKTSKGAIQFPYDRPIPLELIAEIARWSYEEGGR